METNFAAPVIWKAFIRGLVSIMLDYCEQEQVLIKKNSLHEKKVSHIWLSYFVTILIWAFKHHEKLKPRMALCWSVDTTLTLQNIDIYWIYLQKSPASSRTILMSSRVTWLFAVFWSVDTTLTRQLQCLGFPEKIWLTPTGKCCLFILIVFYLFFIFLIFFDQF